MKLAQNVLDVLAGAEASGNHLKISIQLDRKLYAEVNKALVAAGGQWNRGRQSHVFPGDAATVLAGLVNDGTVLTVQDTQFFPTPAAVVDRMIALAGIRPEHAVLEPSAGRGAIASRIAPLAAAVDCIELHERYAADIRAAGYARQLTIADFLETEPERKYDRIVMNPPFTRNADVRHVQHALQFLVPGGRLVSVMGAGIMFRRTRLESAFRAAVEENGWFEPLPDGAFEESGTSVRTVLAIIQG